ncbi:MULTISPECIES: PH domain-containing protein [Pseudomonas]|uniref:PH domain-containing protein n=1 Tax=Pseudomonas TaxID=286 RepID=UPI001475B8FD|nr:MULTISPECIES: PH domain-containing protein [Pseudomonas]MEC4242057.1 PH domain-containing protein [Pseudomonas sp. DSV-1]NNB33993.1 PH domain-containing protein [Pseudomonas fragi]
MTPHLNANEKIVWQCTPSQWNNAGTFLLCGLFFWTVIPLLVAFWSWLVVRNTRFVITSERLFSYRGVLNMHVDELELYRIKDLSQSKSVLMRMVGLGSVTVITSDKTNPSLCMQGIESPDKVQALLREHTELRRIKRGVRELDY